MNNQYSQIIGLLIYFLGIAVIASGEFTNGLLMLILAQLRSNQTNTN